MTRRDFQVSSRIDGIRMAAGAHTNPITSLTRRAYAALPRLVMRTLRPFVRSHGSGNSAFLTRFATPYECAVLSMNRSHWEQKVLRLGLVGYEKVLDLGCGAGQWLPVLAEHNSAVIGADNELRLLKMARDSAAGSGDVRLIQTRAESLCFPTQTFDAVLCYSVLTYTDHEKVLAEMKRVTKAGGKVILGVAGIGYYLKHIVEGVRFRDLKAVQYGVDPIITYWAQSLLGRRSQAITYWTKRRVARLMKRNGFDVVRTFAERKDASWPDTYLGGYFFFCVEAMKRAES